MQKPPQCRSAIASYANGNDPNHQPVLPYQLMAWNNITIRLVLVYNMPIAAKQQAIQDITEALKAGALQHNIARRFTLDRVAEAHEAQDSNEMIGKAVIEISRS